MNVVFRVFDDGVGFRYILPTINQGERFCIQDELTEITLAHDAKAWSIPTNHTEYFEGIYNAELLSRKDTVCTPLTIEYEDSIYLAIHEAALEDYASINLTPVTPHLPLGKSEGDSLSLTRGFAASPLTLRVALSPWQNGVKVYCQGETKSPWRTVIICKTPGQLITSRLMLNLNEPSRIEDTSWIEPGRYIGIWWSIHKKKNTWDMGPNHGATTQNVKRYIDFAARHGFSGVLAEGWNVGWGEGEKVSYLQPYPDFDIEEVCNYALTKGVRFIGHTETWGNTRLLEQQMDSAFAWYNRLGIRAVKTGYVGHLFDGKELAKSQYGIRINIAVMEADIDGDVDAIKIKEATGVPSIQLHTGGMCHLDAEMTRQGLDALMNAQLSALNAPLSLDLIILENVGNLVCPAEFDTGSSINAMILSVPEGDDKPLKYPLMFSVCDLVLVNKIDVMPYFDFDLERCKQNIKMRNPKAHVIPISAKTGEGIDQFADWLMSEIQKWKTPSSI